MGPEGGSGGGLVVAEGTPEQVAGVAASHTGRYLKDVLAGRGRFTPEGRLGVLPVVAPTKALPAKALPAKAGPAKRVPARKKAPAS